MRLIDADELKNAIIHHLCIRSEKNLLEPERSIYNLIDGQTTVEQPKKGKSPTWKKGKAFCGNCGGCLENKEMFSSYHVSSIRFCKWCGVPVDWSNG